MRAIIKTEPATGASFVTDFPEPTVGDNDVLMEVKAASVCGSDREFYEWGETAQGFPMEFPRVLGHEGSGVVLAVGSAVTRVKVGDRIALDSHAACGTCFMCTTGRPSNCQHMRLLANDLDGVFAERVAVPESLVFKIPDSMSFETATLLEPSGVAWHAIQRSGKDIAANVVLVSGCGPIGLLIVKFALMLGATEVIATEPNDYRRGLAEELGATVFSPGTEVLEYIDRKHAHRGGVDVAFEVSGVAAAYPTLFDAVRRNGQVVSVGHAGKPISLNISQYINKKEITLHGIYGRALWDTWEELSALIESGRVDLEWLITHRMPLGELGPVIDLLSGEANKVILYPGQTA
ncbi:L-threonine 3-dehydrogenase [Curtobacterium sp. BH-2-1-1]|uniref:alcohol dehydrogenase catalytic domain-containing protein n=1 Tax=Curtobacterium sp. BH-2-1-1 TaxID=1905847 RepID=UPI00089DF972|nr:alcohol dehydrogenase catalytic domain-containing protein [Curtobacterium sp. BH-2-1-1]AOX65144.1 L-threonine 3-dehydrogenase [Curtobacterium sp. BH-2-1-1]